MTVKPHLSTDQLLQAARNESRPKVARRIQAVAMAQQLLTSAKIAQLTGDDGWLVKTYTDVSLDKAELLERPEDLDRTKYCEVSLNRTMSLPNWEGLGELGNSASKLSCVLKENKPWASYDSVTKKLIGDQDYRTQIGGYPRWVQGADTPTTPDGKPMKLLFQIDSEDNAGLMWGDVGLVYVFYDPDNIANLEFTLQCH